ncbi:MAG TPA: glycosyltransferase family protein [Anaerolineae bacterium]|nr:glycosyltransferase family protein [Anaerolineae bacterium]
MREGAASVVAIIQARMGSSRLPGKVLLDLGGHSMLARVVHRVRRARSVEHTIVAATVGQADVPIVRECERLGVPLFRGSELDVLDRFYQAASHSGAGAIVRITSDCPLVDPDVIDRVVSGYLDWRPDYASNVCRRTYPRGLDTEVVSREALERAWREASEPHQRVHVTPYLYQHPEHFRLLSVTAGPQVGEGASGMRWTVDTAEDLALIREIYRAFGNEDAFGWTDALELFARHPSLAELNRAVRQKALDEG